MSLDIRDEGMGRLVARRLAQWHRTPVPGDAARAALFPTLERWLCGLPSDPDTVSPADKNN